MAKVAMPYAVIPLAILLFSATAVMMLTLIIPTRVQPAPRTRSANAVVKPTFLNAGDIQEEEKKDPVIPPIYHRPVKRLLWREEVPGEEWTPEDRDVIALAKCLWGECRGCSYIQKAAVCWCIFNRVDDSRFPSTIYDVIVQPSQFFGYQEHFPVTDELYEIAYDCIVNWHNNENRVFDKDYLYFTGNGRINVFTTSWGGGGRVWEEE